MFAACGGVGCCEAVVICCLWLVFGFLGLSVFYFICDGLCIWVSAVFVLTLCACVFAFWVCSVGVSSLGVIC